MAPKTGRFAIVEQLLADGITYMFGNPGTVEQGFLDALGEYPEMRYITTLQETNKVLGFIRGLRAQNVTGIFISHNMHHVFQSCDRIVAMARGEIVFDKPVGDTSVEEVQELL